MKIANVFGEESDSASGSENESKIQNCLEQRKRKIAKQQQNLKEKEETLQDSAIYQYDEVYEDIKSSSMHSKKRKTGKSAEDYAKRTVSNLQMAQQRRELDKLKQQQEKRDLELANELQNDEFKEKDVFVTDSYRKQQDELNLKLKQLDKNDRAVDDENEIRPLSPDKTKSTTGSSSLVDKNAVPKRMSDKYGDKSKDQPSKRRYDLFKGDQDSNPESEAKKNSLTRDAKIQKLIKSKITPEELEQFKQRFFKRQEERKRKGIRY
ncbi:unnamed protein product [Ambrosiozyma monospora]|uniref:Unnamed protein product n=1 Tax=Ambrosiozyma monospora TaxID=43982 RepID=A0A9W7DKM5_AMBMO|nr:unnamed protein product [Ambrosiozyma monospora]